ncbi:TIGR03032 family protein [bacterium]|nr:TIGR03032 family protein [bacterium]
MPDHNSATPAAPASPFQIVTSRGFTEWLATQQISLAISTYHLGAVLLLGLKPNGELSMFITPFDRAMGLCAHGSALWVATKQMLWRLEDSLAGQTSDGYDRVYVPRMGHNTGDIDCHDVAVDATGRTVFVATRFNCLATLDERLSFAAEWRPPFISQLAPEDRCHLNGLALDSGAAKYVTLVARSDVADGWRDHRDQGGLVMDITTNTVVAEGLSMPHSPRMHDGKLWLLNAGSGYLGYIDQTTGRFEPVTFLPGYARGLTFQGRYAIVGLSKPRREHAFQGLPLDQNLTDKGAVPRCGLQIVDLESGAVIHWARIEPPIEELYDIAVLPGVVRPKALSLTGPSLANQITLRDGERIAAWNAAPAR